MRGIPILMLHSVAPPGALSPHDWLDRLSVAPELLEAAFGMWRRRGYRTLHLDEAVAYVRTGVPIPGRSVVLTLDDGYLDNWVGLHPLLAAHGFCATVFVSSDYVDPRPVVRPQAGGGVPAEQLTWKGYLSWDEMRAMERDATLRIESHARSHTWHFVSSRIVDFYRPQTPILGRSSLLRFLWLNRHPDRKPFMLDEMADDAAPWGTPIYEFAPALVARRYEPDPREGEMLVAEVAARGGRAFFDRPGWRDALEALVARFRNGRSDTGEAESAASQRARVADELAGSRAALSAGLGRDVRFLSCPQGAMSPLVEDVAAEAGYEAWTKSGFVDRRLNRPGDPPRHLYRCGGGFDLFGASAGTAARVLSQRIVLERYAGSPWAHAATGVISRVTGLLGRRQPLTAPS